MLKLGAVDYTTNVQRNIKSHKESSEKCRNSISWQSQVASADWADVTKTKRISMQAVRDGSELQLYQSGQRDLLIQNSENHTKLCCSSKSLHGNAKKKRSGILLENYNPIFAYTLILV